MARATRKIQKGRPAVAIVVDGKDEKEYINQAKHYYCSVKPALRSVQVKPEMPDGKKVDELFDYAKEKLGQEYSHVILVIDFDDPLNKPEEFEKFKKLYEKYQMAKNNQLTPSQKRAYGWMQNLTLVINSPCLEFWYLLHFTNSNVTKFYQRFKPDLENDVKKLPAFSEYDKGDFYTKSPDIFTRLGGLGGLAHARQFKDGQKFSLDTCRQRGFSEMSKMFDCFDLL